MKHFYLFKIFRKYWLKLRHFLFFINVKKKGEGVKIYFPVKIHGIETLEIGDFTSVGEYTHIWAGDVGLSIGKNVMIAAHCCITTLGHDTTAQYMNKSLTAKKVTIEDDVWLGYNVTILPGVTIGKGSVIGAGSVVTKNVPPFSITVGNPAKHIKTRIIKNNV
jgi:acetyltransferase-like isoleucine patch superfamily enzyme